MRRLHIAFWSDRELTSVIDDLSSVFAAKFSRRDVRRWECYSSRTQDGVYIDVSRTRLDEQAEYNRPVILTMAYERAAAQDDEVRVAEQTIADHLGIDVSVGWPVAPEQSPYDYDFRIQHTYRSRG